MSLAIGRVTGTVISAVMFVVWAPGHLRFGLDRSLLAPLLRFGLPLAGSSILVFAAGNADQITAGSILGPTQLGFYVLAFNLASWPVKMFSQPLRSVAPAAFSRLQHDTAAMTETFGSVLGVLAALTFPVCLLFAASAAPLIEFVYGQQWLPAADALHWLGVAAAFQVMFELAYDYLVVRRFTGSVLVIQIVWLTGLVPFLIVGAKLAGIAGLALAQVVAAAVLAAPLYGWFLHRSGLTVRRTLSRLVLPVVAACVSGGAALALSALIANPFLACAIASLPTLATIALMLYRDRATLRSLRELRFTETVTI